MLDRCWSCKHFLVEFGLTRCRKKSGRTIKTWKNDDCRKYERMEHDNGKESNIDNAETIVPASEVKNDG